MRAVLQLLVLGGAVALGFFFSSWLGRSSEERTERSTATIVMAVQRMARLETVQLEMQQVIDLRDKQERLFGLLKTEDAVLLIASGRVSAGVDLSTMKADAVSVTAEGRRVRVTLPPAAIFSVTLDNDHTFVHTRDTGLLATRNEQLETQARGRAEELFRQAALRSQVLEHAQRNAETTLRALLVSLGFEQVEFVQGPSS